MKKLVLALLLMLCLTMTGCATPMPMGALYYGSTLPITATSNTIGSKTGTATCTSFMSLISFGDCSAQTAAKNGEITKISTVDFKVTSVLGIISDYTTIVTGE